MKIRKNEKLCQWALRITIVLMLSVLIWMPMQRAASEAAVSDITLNYVTDDYSLHEAEGYILFPGENNILYQSAEGNTDRYVIDFAQNVTWITHDGIQYTVINKEFSVMPVYIAPKIVELTSDLTIAVSVIPTEGNSALIIYTCDIENEQELSPVDDWITDIKSNFIICDNAKISVNGFPVPDEDKKVQCITDVMLMYEDGSFLTLENNTQETEKLYGDEAFNMWTSHEQLQPDNQNRKAYVQVKNDIRYTLYTAPENSESLNQYILLDTEVSADE